MSYQLTVNPKGATVAVNILQAGSNVAFYFDPELQSQCSEPVTITTPTIFYVATHGTYQVSLKVQTEEWATEQNQPLNIDIRHETAPQTISPLGPYILGNVHTV